MNEKVARGEGTLVGLISGAALGSLALSMAQSNYPFVAAFLLAGLTFLIGFELNEAIEP